MPHPPIHLRDARQRVGLSQAALAAKVGVSQKNISRLETEVGVEPSYRAHQRIADVVRVSIYRLTYGPSAEDEERRTVERRCRERRARRRRLEATA